MQTIPSKELLSAVLGRAAYPLDFVQNRKAIRYCFLNSTNKKRNISILDFMSQCKEFIKSMGYAIESTNYYGDWEVGILKFYDDAREWHSHEKTFNSENEPAGVVQAAQWLLDNK